MDLRPRDDDIVSSLSIDYSGSFSPQKGGALKPVIIGREAPSRQGGTDFGENVEQTPVTVVGS